MLTSLWSHCRVISRPSFFILSISLPVILLFTGCGAVQKIAGSTDPVGSIGSGIMGSVLRSPDPVTTSFADTRQDYSLPAGFGDHRTPLRLSRQPRSAGGGYLLAPGFYEMTCRSYCLHAGTNGPSKGDGYLDAALKGPRADIIQAIARNSASHLSIPQTTVQLLIWAVLAKTSFKNLSPDLQAASVQLLTPSQLYQLNGGALGLLPSSAIDEATASLPAPARQAIATENQLRMLFQQAGSTYADIERVAVLHGTSGKMYPQGGWSKHPNGYYVRYFPNNYTSTRVQVYVPGQPTYPAAKHGPSLAAIQPPTVEFDATNNVAVPANTSAQRLEQSNVPAAGDGGTDGGSGDGGPGDAGPGDAGNDGGNKGKCPVAGNTGKTIHAKDGNHYKLYDNKVLECNNIGLDGCGLPWWTNNPGNLTSNSADNPTGAYGSIPGITQPAPNNHHFLIFPDYATGRRALLTLLGQNGNKTILDEMKSYAPENDGNNPQQYAQNIANALGSPVTINTKLSDLTPAQLEVVANTIQQIEGYNPPHPNGKEYAPDDPSLPKEVRDKYGNCQ